MPEALVKLRQQTKEFWDNLDKFQKNRIYITSAIVIISTIIALFSLTRPNRVVLISNATQKDIGEMSSILNDSKIWNNIKDGGTSIEINAKDNNRAQIVLAQKGYPKDGMTFEDAIKMIGISTTESDKKQIWKQQQTSDIAAKIKMLDNIEDATVSLALPEQSIFLTANDQLKKPTAYVMIRPRERLTPEQIKGIVMIVSRSVEGLDPKDITVVDNNSNILNSDSGDTSIGIVSSQEEIRLKKAAELQNRVYEYFSVDQYDNFDTIRVVVNPVLDFDIYKSQTKTITSPEGMENGALISSEISRENMENGSIGGIPGTDTNPGTGDAPTYPVGNEGNSSYNKAHEIKNFGFNETLSESEKAVGYLVPERSTMAVSLWCGKRVTDDSKLSEEFIEQVKIAASMATGIPSSNISVNKYLMAPPEITKKPASEITKELISNYGLFAVMMFLVLGLMLAVIPRRKKADVVSLPTSAGSLEFPVSGSINDIVPEIEFEEKSEIKKQIDKFVKQKPEAVAQLLRNWISDDWDI